MLSPDTVLQSRYRIIRQLGQGGMGTVYEALDQRLDTAVALKETLFTEDALRKQFEREARLLARLHHPALPKVSDHFVEGDGQFLVMQFIEGDDLDAMRKRSGGRIRPSEVLKWADQLLDALDYLHSQDPSVIHRDIKPQNLKLTARGQIILLDFGLAKGFTGTITNVTLVKSFFGFTPMYAPLEQIQGIGTDPRSDIYSLGATLYHLLTGITPPDALTRVAATTEGEDDPLLPASQIQGQISSSVSDVLHKAMSIGRNKRFANAIEMRAALAQATETPTASGNFLDADTTAATVVDAPPSGQSSGRGHWDEYSFFEEAGKRLSRDEFESLRRLYDFSNKYAHVTWGTGKEKGTFNVKFDHLNNKSLYSAATNGDLYLNFAWMMDTEAGAEAVTKLAPKFKQLRGFTIPANYYEKYITVHRSQWVGQLTEITNIISETILTDDNRLHPPTGEQTEASRPGERAPRFPEAEGHDEEETHVRKSEERPVEFIGNDEAYLRWLDRHPEGYVLNTQRNIHPNYMILHKASCGMIKSTQGIPPGGFTEGDYIKVCSGQIEGVRAWIRQHGRPDGSFSKSCSACKPLGGHTIPETRLSSGHVANIDDPVVAININQQYPHVRNAEDLYNCTRGMWRVDRARASRARYAFSVYQGVVKQVYRIDRWMLVTPTTQKYWDERAKSQGKYFPPEVDHGRSELIGDVASESIREKYVGKQMPKRHSQNPILYFNC